MTKPLKEDFEDGTIMRLVKGGLIRPSVLNYPVYVNCVEEYMNRGMKKTDAVIETSIKCKVCQLTIWRAIKMIQ